MQELESYIISKTAVYFNYLMEADIYNFERVKIPIHRASVKAPILRVWAKFWQPHFPVRYKPSFEEWLAAREAPAE